MIGVDEIAYTIQSINAASSRAELTTIWNNNKHLHSNKDIESAFKAVALKFPKTENNE